MILSRYGEGCKFVKGCPTLRRAFTIPESGRSAAPEPVDKIVDNVDKMEHYGFDVSEYQGVIDWNRIPEHYSFTIIRAGYGISPIQKDKNFDQNVKGAIDRGLNIGVYWFLYGLSVDDAIKNANACLETIAPHEGKINFPVVLDVEGDTVRYMSGQGVEPSKYLLSEMVKAFCETIEAAGYYAMIYSDNNFINHYLKADLFDRYDLWFAYWVNVFNPSFCTRDCGIWQHTNKGYIDGISGTVDLDYTERDYPAIMKEHGLNHLEPVQTVVVPVSNKVIESGTVSETEKQILIVLNKKV